MFESGENDHIKQILVWIYEDVLNFHLKALRVFTQPGRHSTIFPCLPTVSFYCKSTRLGSQSLEYQPNWLFFASVHSTQVSQFQPFSV
jgi:hypothetical protein